MKIIFCITGLGIGGAEAITVDIANQMLHNGHEIMILYLTGENKQVDRINKKITVVGFSMKKSCLGFLHAQYKAYKIISKWKPDVVHANMVHANLFCRLLRLYCKIPKLISSEHSNNVEGYGRMLMYRLTDFLSDINTNVSKNATNDFINKKVFSSKKSFTVYNGIDLDKFYNNKRNVDPIRNYYGITKTDFLFLNIGRLVPAKDQITLIIAFEKLTRVYPDVKLLIVGEGELKKTLAEKIIDCSLTGKVILAGAHTNVVDFYNAADCFVLSSIWEGFGIVLAEAMACELPVIGTNCGGCVEVIDNEQFIVPPSDFDILFHKMKNLYEKPLVQRNHLGIENRKKAMRFDLNSICMQWQKLYNS